MTLRTAPLRRAVALLVAGLLLSGCGTLARPQGPPRFADSHALVVPDVRMDAGKLDDLEAFDAQMASTLEGPGPVAMLALSGGGANGAYGAGVLIGWSERGDRPRFDVVTGVSTGALAAPFAFLGSAWDAQLRDAYTGAGATRLLSMRNFGALVRPSLFSAQALRQLIDEHVTPQMLAAIAREHATGRRLLVATTNLDSQQTVIWDMGKLASENSPEAHKLFKEVLLASAAIPGVFPPVLIAARDQNGAVISEMHVDGGVTTPFLAIPEAQMLRTEDAGPTSDAMHALYVVVNGRVAPNDGVTPGRIGPILGRTFDTLSKASLRTHLNATVAFSRRNGLQMHLAAIPDNIESSVLAFDQQTMTALFEIGRKGTSHGDAFRRLDDHEVMLARPFTVDEAAIPEGLKPRARPATPVQP
ncbi:patatin-like phospholipase family protein [Caulobacter sp. CCNWLY153]|uniref:patatin-like phospholipase family protein n=1 Tax=unclassified Caulobacter TaxID=2648921 RepID=UPI002FF23208